ncbi:FkbM family methyltransferase [Halobellus rarus]|uniref:FkbM family methyltransferase n=1 Tax=Halobellus rarus TaxID=1126237 RepID=A0ABD6CQE6_9EURY
MDRPASTAGEYRRRDTVSVVDGVVFSRRPVAATRLNDAAVSLLCELDDDMFHTPAEIASETGYDTETVESLFGRLADRDFLEWRPARDPAYRPPVSIVVTVRNDRENLEGCLDALADLSYPSYEVVVVDDGSTDGTVEAATDHQLTEEGRLRLVEVGSAEEPIGIGASRNRGVAAAARDVIAFTDADCRPRPEWLADLVPCLAGHDLIGGRVRPAGGTTASAYEAVNSSLDMGAHAARVDPGGGTPYLPTANLVGTRAVFEAVPFPERNVAEDVEVCWNAVAAGFDVVYSPRGVVEHAYRSGRQFAGRRATYAASEALLARAYGRDQADRVGVPVAGLLVVVLAALAMASSGIVAGVTGGGAALVGGLAVTVDGVRIRNRERQLPDISRGDLVRSWARERLSSAYEISREVLRYYAGPLALAGILACIGGAPALAGGVLVGIVAVTTLPIAVEYRVHDPDVSVAGYAVYYLADHLGYQVGAYRGALAHWTVAHLRPDARFELVGHGASLLAGLTPRHERTDVRSVHVGGVTTRFRVETPAERWWFEDGSLGSERSIVTDLLDRLRPDDRFLDVGANVGQYSCPVGRALEGYADTGDGGRPIAAVEPHPRNVARLAENLDANDVDARIVRAAFGAANGEGILRDDSTDADADADPGIGTHALVDQPGVVDEAVSVDGDGGDESGVATDVVTGDSLVESGEIPQPTVVKIDVEGAEVDVLGGLQRTLANPACRLVYCEVHSDVPEGSQNRRESVRTTLAEHGFDVSTVREFQDGRAAIRAERGGDCGSGCTF